MPAVTTPGPCKAVRKDAALQLLAKGLAGIGLGGVIIALPIEQATTSKFMPDLEVLGNGFVEQRALLAEWVVELGFGCCRYLGRDRRSVARRGMRMKSTVWLGCACVHCATPP